MNEVKYITGDVFLFEPDNSCISQLICKLTNAPVSHAAMYFKDGNIIEQTPPNLKTRSIAGIKDRVVYVRRYKNSNETSSKALLEVAQAHLENEDVYSMGNLVAVGVLCIFNVWKPHAKEKIKLALATLCILLAKAIDKKMHEGKHATTCSQFVYETYREAKYKLHIEREKNANLTADASPSLISLAVEAEKSGRLTDINLEQNNTVAAKKSFDLDAICCFILDILNDTKTTVDDSNNSTVLDDGVYEEIVRFSYLLYKIDEPDSFDNLLMSSKNGIPDKIIKIFLTHMLKNYSGFIMPGTLLNDCPDLEEEVTVIRPAK